MKKAKIEALQPLLQSPERPSGLDVVRHVGYYHPTRNGRQGQISFALDEFRKGRGRAVQRWLTLVPHMVAGSPAHDVIIRALYSDETEVCDASPLDRLCDAIAERSGASYSPTRLRKSRTTHALQGLGGHAAHLRELEGVFQFDGSGLGAGARVLIVDDLMVTGSTLEAIAAAVRSALPGAHIGALVLGCASGLQNDHLDPRFFDLSLDEEPPAASAFAAPRGRVRRAVRSVAPAAHVPHADHHGMQVSRSGVRTFLMYGAAVAVVALLMATLDPLHANKPVPLPALAVTDESSTRSAVVSPQALPAVPPAPAVQDETTRNAHPARVVVPQVGLRDGHSFEARLVTRAAAKAGETVEIMQRYIAEHGPDWYLIRTRTGKTGWVMASVVSRVSKH